MSFVPTLIEHLLNYPALTDPASLASLFSFAEGVMMYFTEKRNQEEQATIDDYLEWLRREDHAELVSLLNENRESFEKLFANLQTSIFGAIDSVNDNVNRLRSELTDSSIDPLKIELKLSGWAEVSGMFTGDRKQVTKLRASLTIVNCNRSALTLKNATGTITHQSKDVQVHSNGSKLTVNGGGGSADVVLTTATKCDWARADEISERELTLSFDQVKEPLCFMHDGTGFQPSKKS